MITGFWCGEFETEFLQELAYGLVFYSIFSNNLEDGIDNMWIQFGKDRWRRPNNNNISTIEYDDGLEILTVQRESEYCKDHWGTGIKGATALKHATCRLAALIRHSTLRLLEQNPNQNETKFRWELTAEGGSAVWLQVTAWALRAHDGAIQLCRLKPWLEIRSAQTFKKKPQALWVR